MQNYNKTFISKKNIKFTIKSITINDLDKIINLQNEIVKSIKDKSLFCPIKKEEFIDSFNNDEVFIVCHDEEIVAFGILVLNRNSDRNLYFTDKSIASSYMHVATSEVIAVHPNYQGNGLQNALFEVFNECANNLSGVKVLAGTVSANNLYSLNNFLKCGYLIYKENLNLYGGYKRNLMIKKLR